jgi:outer membrane protein TolC
MSAQSVKCLSAGAIALAAVLLLTSCAVGPDFRVPAAPDVEGYTEEPLTPRTSSTDAPTGQTQHFVKGRDLPQEWWALLKSPGVNALIEQALKNNPSLQSAIATLRSSKETAYAQEGKFFPFVQYNFNPLRAQTASTVSPVL